MGTEKEQDGVGLRTSLAGEKRAKGDVGTRQGRGWKEFSTGDYSMANKRGSQKWRLFLYPRLQNDKTSYALGNKLTLPNFLTCSMGVIVALASHDCSRGKTGKAGNDAVV